MGDELMFQTLESIADQVDRLAEIIDEFLTLAEAGVPMSATTRQAYAAEMTELRGHRAQLRKALVAFWVQIGSKHAQQVTASLYTFASRYARDTILWLFFMEESVCPINC